jgi:hypothetical protein
MGEINRNRVHIKARGQGFARVTEVISKYRVKNGSLYSAGIKLGYGHFGRTNPGGNLRAWLSGKQAIPLVKFEMMCRQMNMKSREIREILTHDEIVVEDSYKHNRISLSDLYGD